MHLLVWGSLRSPSYNSHHQINPTKPLSWLAKHGVQPTHVRIHVVCLQANPSRYHGENGDNQSILLRCSSPKVYHCFSAPYTESLLPSTRIESRPVPDPKHVFIRLNMMHHHYRQLLVLRLFIRTRCIEIVPGLTVAIRCRV